MSRHVLAYFICAFCLVAGQSPNYALEGTEVNMVQKIPGAPSEILWKYNGNKVVEFDGREQNVYKPFENRVALDWGTAELNITKLRYEDSGDYELEIFTAGRLHRSNYRLEVIGKVAMPTISCEMIDNGSSSKSGIQATLICSAESSHPQLTKIEWSSRGNVQPGPNLTISLEGEHDDEVYSCNVGNPLTSERATFTAKDCYADKSSSVGLIVGLVILFAIIAVLLFLGYMFRRKVKACCTKGKNGDLENQVQSGTTEGSDKKTYQDEEKPLLVNQQRGNVWKIVAGFEGNNGGHNFLKSSLKGKNADKQKPVHPASKKEEDADAENEVPPCDSSHSEEANTPYPAVVLDDLSEDTQCDVQSSTAPEQTGSDKKMYQDEEKQPLVNQQLVSEKEADEDEEASAPASGVPPPPQLQSPSTPSSPHMAPEGITVKLKEDANSEEMNKAENQSIATSQQPQSATLTRPDNSNTNTFQESPDTVQADPEEEGMAIHGTDEPEGQPDSGTTEEDKGSDKKMYQDEEKQPLVNQQLESEKEADEDEEASAPASGVPPPPQLQSPSTPSSPHMAPEGITVKLKEDANSEEMNKAENQSIATSQQPQSATLTRPDNSNTNTFQESPDTVQADPEEEGTAIHDTDESEGQPDSSTTEEDKGSDKKTYQDEEKPLLVNQQRGYVWKIKEKLEGNNGGQN